jgi:hypothetical protein
MVYLNALLVKQFNVKRQLFENSELTVFRYLKRGDVYVHADLHGAATVVIRNNPMTPDSPIPPSTLSQAGTLAVACSNAWDSKAGMSAWWVNADQVSKSAPTGEFLPTGSFMVRGKKNFLPPAVLLLGFGVIFQISEESKARHVKHRLQDDEPVTSTGDAAGGSASTEAEEVPGLDDDDGSVADDHESDADEEQVAANPLQTQPVTEQVVSGGDEEPPTQQTSELQVEDVPKETEHPEAEESNSENESPAETQQSTGTQTPSQQSPKKGPAPPKRGKKGKAKKIATKYKDQDEEDRLAAQQLIGAAAGLEKAEAEAKAKAAREAELAFQKERRRAQHQRTQEETAEHEEIRRLMLEEGQDVLGEGEEGKMTSFETLVGIPLKGDEILEAIPVCAPWAAMGKYKYKAKLQPGAQKKGKAVKEVVGRWLIDSGGKGKVDERSEDTERMWPREVELLKGWKVEEVTNTIPVGKVRVMMAGGSAGAASKGPQAKGRGGKGSKKQR